MLKTFDIVIPHCNVPRVNILATRCLRSIRQFSRDYRVIWIQNGGSIPAQVASELESQESHLAILSKENLGFVKATNMGLARSAAPYVVLMNNDTEASRDWLAKLRRSLDAGAGISGPLSTASGSWQGRWSVRGKVPDVPVPANLALAFFCTMIRRDVIETVGMLDEGFGPGMGDDDDYCWRASARGFRLALVQDLVIRHHHRSTFRALYSRPEITSLQRAAIARLESKRKGNGPCQESS